MAAPDLQQRFAELSLSVDPSWALCQHFEKSQC